MAQRRYIAYQKQVDVSAANGVINVPLTDAIAALVTCNLSTLAGGAAPTVTYALQYLDEFGNVHPLVAAFAALNAVGGKNEKFIGSLAQLPFSGRLQIAWTTTGAPTGAVLDLCVYGYADR